MPEKLKFRLRTLWLILGISTLVAPVIVPSIPGSNVIGYATAAMLLLSFPSSLFAAPLMIFIGLSTGFHPNAIEGQYLNLILLFAVGCLQWFWIAPRLAGEHSNLQTLDLAANGVRATLLHPVSGGSFSPFDADGRTPVERVIEYELESKR